MKFGVFVLLLVVAAIFLGAIFLHYQQKRKSRAAALWEEKQAQLRAENLKKEQLRKERIARAALEEEKKFETFAGFLEEKAYWISRAKKEADGYAGGAIAGRMDPDSRRRHVAWESLYLLLSSKNPKTIESRIIVMCRQLQKMKWPHIPIGDTELRIASTHYYVAQIEELQRKLASYKTQPPKEKAAARITELFEEASVADMVYQKALNDFRRGLRIETR